MTRFPGDLSIIDPHHHLWDLSRNYYPWLTDRVTKRVCGEYSSIRRDYVISDFRADIGDLPVVATVHVEAAHDRSDPVRETTWLHELAEDTRSEVNPAGFPNGFVVYCDLSQPDAISTLNRHLDFPRVRGVRQMLHESIVDPDNPSPPLYANDTWLANLSQVGRLGLCFDLQLFPEQMSDGYRIANANPELQFVLCHTGQPLVRTEQGMEDWRNGLKLMARLDNVAIKISGLGMFDRQWTTESLRPLILETIDIFGCGRAMFASNFPVDGMMTSYPRLWCAYEEITRGFSHDERCLMFAENARRVYSV